MSHQNDLPDPASVVLRRRIEWMDTDAAGIYHWTTVFRLAEAAEAALHTALGIADFTFGATPRVKVEATFARSLRFNDPVDVELARPARGRTSAESRPAVRLAAATAAEGSVKTVLIDRSTGRAAAWPDEVRAKLSAGGPQRPPERGGPSGRRRQGPGAAARARAAGAGARAAAPAGSAASPARRDRPRAPR